MQGRTRQSTTAGKPITANENALRSVCKWCGLTIYVWQPTVWCSRGRIGLIHAEPDDCDEGAP